MAKQNNMTTISSAYALQARIAIHGSDIIRFVEEYFNLKPGEINMKTRIREVVLPRQIVIWFLANKNMKEDEISHQPGWSKIARQYFPTFDHATLMHAFKTVNDMMHTSSAFRQQIEDIQFRINLKTITISEVSVMVEFARCLTGFDKATIEQKYNYWSKQQEK